MGLVAEMIPEPIALVALLLVPAGTAGWWSKTCCSRCRGCFSTTLRICLAALVGGAMFGTMASFPPGLYAEVIVDSDISFGTRDGKGAKGGRMNNALEEKPANVSDNES